MALPVPEIRSGAKVAGAGFMLGPHLPSVGHLHLSPDFGANSALANMQINDLVHSSPWFRPVINLSERARMWRGLRG